jgi:hypothetical protein
MQAPLEAYVDLLRKYFDAYKELADKYHWPAILFYAKPKSKSRCILIEWLMTTQYDVYTFEHNQVILVTPDGMKNSPHKEFSIYLVPKGTVDFEERVRTTRAIRLEAESNLHVTNC